MLGRLKMQATLLKFMLGKEKRAVRLIYKLRNIRFNTKKKDRLIKEKWPIVTHEDIKENRDYYLIFVSVNPEQVSIAVKHLAPYLGNATVLFIGNFWKDIQKSVEPIPSFYFPFSYPSTFLAFQIAVKPSSVKLHKKLTKLCGFGT